MADLPPPNPSTTAPKNANADRISAANGNIPRSSPPNNAQQDAQQDPTDDVNPSPSFGAPMADLPPPNPSTTAPKNANADRISAANGNIPRSSPPNNAQQDAQQDPTDDVNPSPLFGAPQNTDVSTIVGLGGTAPDANLNTTVDPLAKNTINHARGTPQTRSTSSPDTSAPIAGGGNDNLHQQFTLASHNTPIAASISDLPMQSNWTSSNWPSNVPTVPPIEDHHMQQPQNTGGWECCGVLYKPERKRCGKCNKWKDGGRPNMQGRKNKKKQPRLANNAERTPTRSRVPAIAPTTAMAGPTRDINLTPTGAQALNMRPLTG